MNCKLCETATAEVIKREAEYEWDAEGNETIRPVELQICRSCADTYYDGTEEYPGVLPL